MKKSGPKPATKKDDALSCECDCANCDIGAHERCTSSRCTMPKWKDVKDKPKRPD